MSLIVACFVPTGVALSADSRATLTVCEAQQKITKVLSDATQKVFLLKDRFGIATCGDGNVNDFPVAHFIEQFDILNNSFESTEDCAQKLLEYFRILKKDSNINFLVVGYEANTAWVIWVSVKENLCMRKNIGPGNEIFYGSQWGGDCEIANRLMKNSPSVFNLFNLQNAIDFTRHIIRTTAEQQIYETQAATVGGPIDTLVISNKLRKFVCLKELHCQETK